MVENINLHLPSFILTTQLSQQFGCSLHCLFRFPEVYLEHFLFLNFRCKILVQLLCGNLKLVELLLALSDSELELLKFA